jgi:hypothetical protein
MIALPVLAAGGGQKSRLRLGLYAFSDTLDVEFMGEPDGGAHHGSVAEIAGNSSCAILRRSTRYEVRQLSDE